MKKIFSFLLAVLMLISALPVAYAAESGGNWSSGTTVVYTAANTEGWTLTVPAKLAPGSSGTVTLEGYWPSNKQLTVTAQDNVVLTNSINAANQKSLDISFVGISELGSDTNSQKFSESISVEPIANALFGKWNGVFYYTVGTQELDTVSQLQEQYDFEYYSTMNLAVTDVNNGTIGANADVDKEDAVAGIYTDENGGVNVVLLQDTTEATRIQPTVDMTINLGGHTLSSEDLVVIQPTAGTITIDGRLEGSTIKQDSNTARYLLQCINDSTTIVKGGTYTLDLTVEKLPTSCFTAFHTAHLKLENATINTASLFDTRGITLNQGTSATITNSNINVNGTELSYGIYTGLETNAIVTNCNVTAIAANGKSFGLSNNGIATISSCGIKAYANYLYGDETYYADNSIGVINDGTLTFNDCYVTGTHSGISNRGPLYVNGGTYEGYGHGGFYFAGTGTTSYVRNATIRECAMPDGYTATANCNGVGFYIGGDVGNDNIDVYMDNCDIYGSSNQIVLRGSSGEQNNSLYISNSNVYDMDGDTISIRIDNDTHRLYIGTGNNFTVDNAVTWGSITNWDGIVINTDETYTYNN